VEGFGRVGGTYGSQQLLIPVAGLGIQPGYGIYPEGVGDPLGTPTVIDTPPDAWLECPPSNRTCVGGILT
jgi:hypothetical protein